MLDRVHRGQENNKIFLKIYQLAIFLIHGMGGDYHKVNKSNHQNNSNIKK